MKFMQSNFINALGCIGGLSAFIVAFGWLMLPIKQFQLIDAEALMHFNVVLESVSLFGMSPWLMLGMAVFAVAMIYLVIFNLSVSKVLLAVFATAMALLAINTLNSLGITIALIMICSLMFFSMKAR